MRERERERERDRERCMRMKGSIYSKNGAVNTTRLGVYSTSLMKFVFAIPLFAESVHQLIYGNPGNRNKILLKS